MAVNRTVLSAGEVLWNILKDDETLSQYCNDVFPVVWDGETELPYICYKRGDHTNTPVKSSIGADSCSYTFWCYSRSHDESVDMAEALRAALEGKSWVYTFSDGQKLNVRSVILNDSDEGYDEGAYAQVMAFIVKANPIEVTTQNTTQNNQ